MQAESPPVEKADFIAALHKVSPSLKKGLSCNVDLKGVLWNEIGGLDDVKAEIQQACHIECSLSISEIDPLITSGMTDYDSFITK